MRTTDNSPFIISQKARHCSRPLIPGSSTVIGAHSIKDLAQIVCGRMLVQIESHVTHLDTSILLISSLIFPS
jgi:hypothetical protein